ncbi:MAG TPA: type IV pilus twitching motility protein PilT [Candidatus Limnocylindrales bacterium]|nr:type IV pilus twitching motility protein PilT [Candidatus Limnocylindrales bacterium]
MSNGSKYPVRMDQILITAVEKKASDVHIVAGGPPLLRLNREIVKLDYPELQPDDVADLLAQIVKPHQVEILNKDLELDFSYSLKARARFRGNAMFQRGTVAVALRIVPVEVPKLENLGVLPGVRELCFLPRGLVLVTGPTGSGKSTTLAAMIDVINRERNVNIVTIEDPIEFLHKHIKSSIKQREVRFDTFTFTSALRHVLRHDPDVILIGEMRDLESIGIALTAAETGHLVFSTLHTQTAPLTVNRIVDIFEEHQRSQIRQQLAGSLQAVLSQQLIPNASGNGQVLAMEYLAMNAAVRNMIREGKEHQLYSAMQASHATGMKTMDIALAELFAVGKISRADALERCVDKTEMERLLQRHGSRHIS